MLNKHSILRGMTFLIALLSFCKPPNILAFGSGTDICTPPVEPVELISPTIITDCTESGLRSALAGGGHVSFSCGEQPLTISIASALTFNPTVDTVLDGGNLITLDGGKSTRIFYKDWSTTENITITLQSIKIINGLAPSGDTHSGGAFYGGYNGMRLHIINSTFENNSTSDINKSDNQGGAVFVHNSFETIISGSYFAGNTAGGGGAFGAIASDLYLFNSTFTNNGAVDDSAGGIVKGHGGAIHLDGVGRDDTPYNNRRVHVCGSTFEKNTSIRGGGALKVTISDNRNTIATYEKSSFIGNSSSGVTSIEGHGGAIYHIEDDHDGGSDENNVELHECYFENNSGWRQGGAAWFSVLGKVSIVNNTFVDNRVSATDYGMGGALVLSSGTSSVTNNTFARNFANFHGGAIQASTSGSLMLKNNLFYYNESTREWACYQLNLTDGADIDGGGNLQYPQTRYNQSGDKTDCLVTATATFDDPEIAEPANNGGPTKTMTIPPSSPAINSGSNNAAPVIDQRGYDRTDLAWDIGAYEYIAEPTADYSLTEVIQILQIATGIESFENDVTTTDVNEDQKIGIAEAINVLKYLKEGGD